MHSPAYFEDKVLKEYEKKQEKHKAEFKEKTEILYKTLPALKSIDEKISSLAIKHASRIIKEGITPDEAVSAVRSERKQLETERNKLLGDYRVVIDYDCDKCLDTGIVDGQKCECYMLNLKKLMLSEINGFDSIHYNFSKDTFDNFSLKWYSQNITDKKINISPYENMKSVYSEARTFCDNFDTQKKNLYFYGTTGTGKTYLAGCIANEIVSKGYKVFYQSAYKLFQFMEDYKFCRIDRETNASAYDSIYNCDLLIIDDLGTEFGTAYTCSVLFDILNTRELNEKSTIISTNLNLSNLENKYTDRIHSRILGNFEIFRFMGDDIRILKKQNGR